MTLPRRKKVSAKHDSPPEGGRTFSLAEMYSHPLIFRCLAEMAKVAEDGKGAAGRVESKVEQTRKKLCVRPVAWEDSPELDNFMLRLVEGIIRKRSAIARLADSSANLIVQDITEKMTRINSLSSKASSLRESHKRKLGEANEEHEVASSLTSMYGTHRLHPAATKILMAWFWQNITHPYPSMKEKEVLAENSGLSNKQIRNWLTNIRKRHWTPIEEGTRAAIQPRRHNFSRTRGAGKQD